ncbi:GTP pyrophosphokinase [Deefgea piscis]|uniref:GTP pyrophosphokinase n=1 Tax=Deefgea piscis TaxID=2739061 RepID=UPI001C80B30A|nr:hypothetical protein [Deefgea piscis]QZA81552.1 hypothetical protein K4H25_02490 [Deefgea piscis]
MDSSLNRVWKDRPEMIRCFYEKLPIHQRLCDEVKYILERKIKLLGVEIGHLTSRAKTLTSFCEKIERKTYKNPFEEITDFSGVRIVYLYASDRINLERLVEEEFEIHEKVDKVSDQGVEKFGYGALHYIVSLKELHAGARYDDLMGMNCEIQIRTILQDAWAIVAHHLSYKHEEDIPNELKRKLHALSGLFETADDQFERINNERIKYQEKIRESIIINHDLSLEAEVNLDSLMGYISWRFPDREEISMDSVADLLEELNKFGYKKLIDVEKMINRSLDAVLAAEKKYPPSDSECFEPVEFNGIGLIRSALDFMNEDYRKSRQSDYLDKKMSFEFLKLLK